MCSRFFVYSSLVIFMQIEKCRRKTILTKLVSTALLFKIDMFNLSNLVSGSIRWTGKLLFLGICDGIFSYCIYSHPRQIAPKENSLGAICRMLAEMDMASLIGPRLSQYFRTCKGYYFCILSEKINLSVLQLLSYHSFTATTPEISPENLPNLWDCSKGTLLCLTTADNSTIITLTVYPYMS